MIQFFIPHDMHVVYIMETAPARLRARMYSCIKFVANMGVMLVPVLRRMLMQEASQWRQVYLIPATVGLVCSFIALLTARETDAFIDARLRYLKMSEQERNAEKAAGSGTACGQKGYNRMAQQDHHNANAPGQVEVSQIIIFCRSVSHGHRLLHFHSSVHYNGKGYICKDKFNWKLQSISHKCFCAQDGIRRQSHP
jgi:hypothetical protein